MTAVLRSDWVFSFITIYQILIVFISLSGNSLVLYSSLDYSATNLDKMSIILLENLAVADLSLALLHGIPNIVTLSARTWVFGEIFCYIQGSFGRVPMYVEFLLIAAISFYKFYAVVYPFNVCRLSILHARFCATSIWLFCSSYVFMMIVVGQYVYFEPTVMRCQLSGFKDSQPFVVMTGVR